MSEKFSGPLDASGLVNNDYATERLADLLLADLEAIRKRDLPSLYEALLGVTAPASFTEVQLKNTISRLEEEIRTLHARTQADQQAATEVEELRTLVASLKRNQELSFLLSRVTSLSHEHLDKNEALRERFSPKESANAFVLSIDIRRSTDLMLKARSAEMFAVFMRGLCETLEGHVKANYGVFDKFTGDGILAFFPEFFTGEDAGYHAIEVARTSIQVFERLYKAARRFFTAVPADVGLGIGLDYGSVHVIPMSGGLTAVGEAVVYACRIGSTPAGTIAVNQPAYEVLTNRYPHLCRFTETVLDVKREGGLICYHLGFTDAKITPAPPPWLSSSNQAGEQSPHTSPESSGTPEVALVPHASQPTP